MRKQGAKKTDTSLPKTWGGLTRLHSLRPISDKVDYENAMELIDALAVRDHLSRDQEDYLKSLTILLEAYEKDHIDMDISSS